MPGSRDIACDFFGLHEEDGSAFPLLGCAQPLMSSPTAARNFEKDGDIVRLHEFRDFYAFEPCHAGILIRLRRGAHPQISKIDTDLLQELDLPQDQHLAEVLHFLYFPERDILVSERNRFVGSEYLFRDYFIDKSGHKKLQCEHFLKKASAKQIDELSHIRKVEIKLEYDPQAFNFDGTGTSLDGVLQMAEEFGTRRVTLYLSVGRHKGELAAKVKEMARRAALRHGRLRATSVRLIGQHEGSSAIMLELLDAKLDVIVPIQWKERHLPSALVWHALRDGFDRMVDQLPDRR